MENQLSVNRSTLGATQQSPLDHWLPLPLGWVLVGAIIFLQWGTFAGFANREIIWAYPAHFDQTTFLGLSYQTFEQMLNEGVVSGLWAGLTAQVPQGKLLHSQAALLYLLRAPSRLSALTVNWLHLIFLECAIVYTLRWLTGRWSVALIGLGLLLTTTSRFAPAGGLMDFRADFGASCLYGVFLCAVVRSNLFKSVRWSLVVGIFVAWMILFRHLTTLSVALVMFLLLVLFGIGAFSRRKNPADRGEWVNRVKGVIASGLVALLLAAPVLWTTRQTILNYYGQLLTTDEGRLRIEEFRVSQTSDFLLYYPRSLIYDHLGNFCLAAMALLLTVMAVVVARTPRRMWRTLPTVAVDPGMTIFFLGAALLGPLMVLTTFPSRSPVVGSFLVPPAIAWIVAIVVAFSRFCHGRARTRVLISLSAMVVSMGIFTDLSATSQKKTLFSQRREDVRQLGQLYDEIGMRSIRWGWHTPRVAFDRIHDYLHPAILQPWFYERHGVLISPISVMRTTILPATAEEALKAIDATDFAVLTDPSSADDPGFPYPINRTMKELYPKVHAAAEDQLVPIRRVEAFAQRLTLYMRVPLRLEGASGDWITSDGFMIVGSGELLRDHPTIKLSGRTILFEHFGNSLGVRAQLLTPGEPAKEVPASISLPGPEYSLVVYLNPSDLPADQEVRVKILFDKYVVPKDVGLNEDTRQLVIVAPNQIRAIRR